jgi:hypothetical protein
MSTILVVHAEYKATAPNAMATVSIIVNSLVLVWLFPSYIDWTGLKSLPESIALPSA